MATDGQTTPGMWMCVYLTLPCTQGWSVMATDGQTTPRKQVYDKEPLMAKPTILQTILQSICASRYSITFHCDKTSDELIEEFTEVHNSRDIRVQRVGGSMAAETGN